MSMLWNQCTPRDEWICRTRRPIHLADIIGLLHLYQPIVGSTAIALYLTLAYQAPPDRAGRSDAHSHLYLMNLLSVSWQDLLENRFLLEGVGLLNTYEVRENTTHRIEYELVPPLVPERFFQSDVLSITLYHRLGKDSYLALRRQLLNREGDTGEPDERVNVTKSFQEVFGCLSPSEVAAAQSDTQSFLPLEREPSEVKDGQVPPFHWDEASFDMIRSRLKTVIPDEAWTDEVKRQIQEIRFLYGLSDPDLLRALQNPYITRGGKIDIERLRQFVKKEYRLQYGEPPMIKKKALLSKEGEKAALPEPEESPDAMTEEEKHIRELEQLSPLELLSYFQDGMRIPDADVELVARLMHEYGLPHGVINVLLEYVLYTHDYKLPKALVEKIAGHWKRRKVQTAREAMEIARRELNWEWKKQQENSRLTSSRPRTKAIREEKLPYAVAMQMERAQQQASQTRDDAQSIGESAESLAEKRARIQAKLTLMRKRLGEKGNRQ
ncbi:replication initiation and membrane attachment family protein [Polycladomyces subterraneus]|uniref:DnaD domain protein n=1 Tax=Polycladomyces subterraneus TaxID=1016997 RepID=A0ABT8IJF2_9BACL|nr:DnaD domain protein [Polycladomyces subterraneus]MDN4592914.1 DnaD domain protein [Polycladomyces subterraneus]